MRAGVVFCIAWLWLCAPGRAQQRFTIEKSRVSFYSKGVVEDIAATNTKVNSIFDPATGEVAYLLSMKDFQFRKKLMQTHFNEKYVESEKYPHASFAGKIVGFDPTASGIQPVTATGRMTMHGVTQEVQMPGTAERQGNKLAMRASFVMKLQDYNMKVPQIVWQNVAEQVEVTVDFSYRAQ